MSEDQTVSEKTPVVPVKKERVLALDVLRGFDLFVLLCIGPLATALFNGPFKKAVADSTFWTAVSRQFHHVPWEGFVAWDLIMPLFLFMVGVAIPFSLAKYISNGRPTEKLYLRIFRRVILLWIFGMIVQGHLLDLKIQGLDLYSNTLQAIAAGYLFASIFYLTMKVRWQIIAFCVLLLGYWALMTFVKVGEFGGGSFLPDTNLAEWIDQNVLGSWRDGVSFTKDGNWTFSAGYHYTWILSSLTFAATVLSGVFAGELIRRAHATSAKASPAAQPGDTPASPGRSNTAPAGSGERSAKSAAGGKPIVFWQLLGIGVLMTLLGALWSEIPQGSFGYCPLIKVIWTPSMVLFSSGLSFMLLALFYGVLDVMKLRFGTGFLVVIGMNAITAYTLAHVIKFRQIAEMVLYGTQQYLNSWYAPVMNLASFMILFYILWLLYRNKCFLRL